MSIWWGIFVVLKRCSDNDNQTTMSNLKETLGLRNGVDQFISREAALRCAANRIKLHVVMLGDNGKYWIACFADAQRLHKMGYEIAN
jgi:hypothetical protein